MSTFASSSQVVAGNDILATDLNNLRKDVLQMAGDIAASTGSANAYVLAINAQIAAYATNQKFKFIANFANTGAATVNVNTLGAKTIKKNHDVDLEANDIENGSVVEVVYDGTNMQMISAGAIDISSANKTTLAAGDTSNASSLHKHLKNCGLDSRAVASGAGTQNIAHGLGVTPKLIKILCIGNGLAQYWDIKSHGVATGTGNQNSISPVWQGTAQSLVTSTSNIINAYYQTGGSPAAACVAPISALDATNITLNFTTINAGGYSTTTWYIQWEAYA